MQTRIHQMSRYRIAFKSLLAGVVFSCLSLPAYATDSRQEILDQQDGCVVTDPELVAELQALNAQQTWVELNYSRFDVFIDSAYYDHNTPEIDEFFDTFVPRFDLLEDITRWSSENTFGNKLRINVTEVTSPTACTGGSFWPFVGSSFVDLRLADPLYDSVSRACTWRGHMEVLVHEVTHAITPKYIIADPVGVEFGGWWLREGWAEYYEYNLLVMSGDISQDTADSRIFSGTSFQNWTDYVNNDYHDTSPDSNEIQASQGYAITAWMLSMLRDDHNLDWAKFYQLFESNEEVLEGAWNRFATSVYFIDAVILDIFTRASSADMTVFQYDGPSGPGWGVRHIPDIDWYADLTVNISLSDTLPNPADTIDVYATVHNTGDVSLDSVDILITIDTNLTYEVFVNVPSNDSVVVSTQFAIPGELSVISANVDRNDRKIELDDSNNTDTLFASLGCCSFPGDANSSGSVNIADVTFLIARIFAGGLAPVCNDEADANGNDTVNIADVTYLIARIFAGGSAPLCGNTGI